MTDIRALNADEGDGGVLAVLVDLTDQRRLETVRQEFVANASHELRTPIAAISSAVETLLGAAASDPNASAHFAKMIARNADRLRNLVDDLLALSRLESGKLAVELKPVALRALAEATLSSLASAADARNTRLECSIPESLAALADPRGIEHVLGNLVDNAIKYCPPGARVTVSGREANDVVEVSVNDNGPGIAPEHRERIFERFYRVDTGRSRDLGGTGLGLSIVRHWVEAMGGSVQLRRSSSSGTEFCVRLKRPLPPNGDDPVYNEESQ